MTAVAGSPAFAARLEALRRHAALAGPFDPMAALQAAVPDAMSDPVAVVELISALERDCTIDDGSEERAGLWLMRPGPRRKVLATLPSAELTAEGSDIARALAGDGPWSPEAVDMLVAAPPETPAETPAETGAEPTESRAGELARVAVALDRAGPGAPAFDRVIALRGALNRAQAAAQTDRVLAPGFFGREAELDRLHGWIARLQETPPSRTLHVSGLPGIGKSYLLERLVQQTRAEAAPVLVRLDFDRGALDRGHMIRRAATNWGDSREEAERADRDSYHYTVASPQHMSLNRNTRTWLGLEDYVLGSARTHGFRACVLTGPVFSPDDPPLGESGASIPLEYFKVVAMAAEEPGTRGIVRLHATAYVLSQGRLVQRLLAERGVPESAEGFAFGAYRTFQLRIEDLEAQTGYDFGPLRMADPLARALTEEGAEAGRRFLPLDRLESAVL